ncbi:MAG: hypothetical protein AAF629_21440, partial [Chloroflexota bacterium]
MVQDTPKKIKRLVQTGLLAGVLLLAMLLPFWLPAQLANANQKEVRAHTFTKNNKLPPLKQNIMTDQPEQATPLDARPHLYANAITGTIFRDYNANGQRDSLEPILSTPITITAYSQAGQVAQTMSQLDGSYSL